MLKVVKFIVIVLIGFSLDACKKSDTPTPTEVELPENIIGTFRADCLYYTNGSNNMSTCSGAVATLIDTGNDTYSITFSNNVPALVNLKFEVDNNGNYVSVDIDGSTAGITLSAYDLNVGVNKTSESWRFLGYKWK